MKTIYKCFCRNLNNCVFSTENLQQVCSKLDNKNFDLYLNYRMTSHTADTYFPVEYSGGFLPSEQLPVLELLKFDLPKTMTHTSFEVVDFLSTDTPNTDNLVEIKTIPIPPWVIIQGISKLLPTKNKFNSLVSPHLPHFANKRFPLWVVDLWNKARIAIDSQRKWAVAVQALGRRNHIQAFTDAMTQKKISDCYSALASVPWSSKLKGFDITPPLTHLTSFFTKEWLDDDHVHLILELLRHEIYMVKPQEAKHIHIHPQTHFINLLVNAAKNPQDYLDSNNRSTRWLYQLGNELASGLKHKLGIIINQNANHWVAAVIDFRTHLIWYGDSMGHPLLRIHRETLKWWGFTHTGKWFDVERMPITLQHDGHSCGIFASNALASFFLQVPLIPAHCAADTRLDLFLQILSKHQLFVSTI